MINKYTRLKKEAEKNLEIEINIFYLDSCGLYADIFKDSKKIISNYNIADSQNTDSTINNMLKEFLKNDIYTIELNG